MLGLPVLGCRSRARSRRNSRRSRPRPCNSATSRASYRSPPAAFFLAHIESVSAGRAVAAKHGYALDPRQELLGLGAAALGQGYPVAGGLSQSAVNDKAGVGRPGFSCSRLASRAVKSSGLNS